LCQQQQQPPPHQCPSSSRIVDTFGQRANDREDTRGTGGQTKLKDGGDDEKRRLAPVT